MISLYKFLNSIIVLLGTIPLPIRRKLGSSLGFLWGYFSHRDQKIMKLQLETFLKPFFPKSSNFDTQILSQKVGSHIGKSFAEAVNLTPILNNLENHFHNESIVRMEKLNAENEGKLVLSAHIGNWDLLAGLAIKIGIPLCVIAKKSSNENIQFLLENFRLRYGVRTIWRESNEARSIVRAFKSGATIAALIDQDTNVKTIQAKFFGYNCATPSSLIDLALRMNIPIYISFVVNDGGKFRVKLEKLCGKNSNEIIDKYHEFLQSQIISTPEQWVWFHKRWRTREVSTKHLEERETDKNSTCNSQIRRLSSAEYIKFLKHELTKQ